MVLRSTSAERTSAATKFWSFSRKAQSLATQRSSLSRHQPVYWGSPSGAAVLAFWTLTSLPRQPVGRADVLEVDAVDAEPVEFLERGEFPGDAFVEVREALGLSVVVGDGKDVDFDGHGRVGWQRVLAEGAEDGLGADDDHLRPADDLARGADRVLKLVASHQSAPLEVRPASRPGRAARPWGTLRASRWSRGRDRSGPGAGRARRRPRRATPTGQGCGGAAGLSRYCGAARGCAR